MRNWLALSSLRSDSGGLLHRATGRLPPGPRRLPTAAVDAAGLVLAWAEGQVLKKSSKSLLIVSASVVGMPWGKPA